MSGSRDHVCDPSVALQLGSYIPSCQPPLHMTQGESRLISPVVVTLHCCMFPCVVVVVLPFKGFQ